MMFTISLLPKAQKHIETAFEWYETISAELGLRFIAAVDEAISSLEKKPHNYFNETRVYRRLVITGFPYKIIYEIENNKVFIVAVKHFSQDIDY